MHKHIKSFPSHPHSCVLVEEIDLAPEMANTPLWKDAPLAPVELTPGGHNWRVIRCPYCECEHEHGVGVGDPRQWLGGRVAHCHPSPIDYPEAHWSAIEYQLVAVVPGLERHILDLFFPSMHPPIIPQHRRIARAPIQGAVRDAVWAKTDGKCVYCGVQTKPFTTFAVDHIVPIIRGGGNEISNLAPCCKQCNSSKHGRTPALWRAQMARMQHVFWFEREGIEL